jgi:site-specific DNA-methyltransferase (adenine-specific)
MSQTYKIHHGSNLDILPTLPDNSVDSIVTDPPYELGFMGKSWDSTGIAYNVQMWKECLRVLKPGGHLLAFSGSRTYHRMAVAIEDAGFQIRDQMMWVYGSGFPKSHNIGKAVDKLQGNKREVLGERKAHDIRGGALMEASIPEFKKDVSTYQIKITKGNSDWEGWGTALKPAHEPIVLARKPIDGTIADNVLKWGVGGLNIDGCRVDFVSEEDRKESTTKNQHEDFGTPPMTNNQVYGDYSMMKPKNYQPTGRFPANFMHDGSQQVLDLFPQTGISAGGKSGNSNAYQGGFNEDYYGEAKCGYGDNGSAARFFYCPKTSKKDRNEGCEDFEDKKPAYESHRANYENTKGIETPYAGTGRSGKDFKNNHPTVKPTELMRYLCRLVTPPNGTVLDPFNGSGSTGKGAVLEGFNYIGIELDPEYIKISEARINAVL